MALLARIFSLRTQAPLTAVVSLLAGKYLPRHLGSGSSWRYSTYVWLVSSLVYIIFWCQVYPRYVSPLRHVPGPKSIISLGYRGMLKREKPMGDLYLELVKKYPGEDLLSMAAFDERLLVTNPQLLADLFVHRSYDYVKPPNVSNFLRLVLGNGLILSEGDQHKFQRKNIAPAFNFRHIKNLYPMMWTKAVEMTNLLRSQITQREAKDSNVVELRSWGSKIAMDIIGVAGLGREFNMLNNADDPLLQVYHELLEPSQQNVAYAMACFMFGLGFVRLLPWRMNQIFNGLTNSLGEHCRAMVREKREAIEKRSDEHFDILSLLIKSDNFSDDDLKDQLLTFLAAGHETTAGSITWICYLLSKHQDAQQKLRTELQKNLSPGILQGDTTDIATILEQLPYLNGVMNESLRLYPTIPLTSRSAIRDTQLGPQFIAKGTRVLVMPWLLNRSPSVWGADAVEFRPERWISENGKPNQTGGASSNYDMVTFMHGARSCIGQGFAKAELRCILAALAGSFSWELAMDDALVVPKGVITIKPANGLYLRLTPLEA
ncbi:cytochrome P450 [Stachybotrys elegans]|uniref:Cytochrome P450 n=1 Tax=Stachybotrys elegans TaxID=80388 RepID=A0A8K0SY86_9HYPO|nr:cytochrome P450 [Stachybotrys elegans]